MKLKLYRIENGLKEFLLMETAPLIQFDNNISCARFYPVVDAALWQCNKLFMIPVGFIAEITDD